MSHPQQQANSTERKLGIGKGCRFTKPIPEIHLPQQGCLANTSPVPLTRKQVSKHCNLWGHFSSKPLEDGGITNIVILLSHKKVL